MPVINNPHDRYFKATMSDLRVAQDFFKNHLPENIIKEIDLNSLKRCNESFVDDELSALITDMLFSADFLNNKGYLYLLLEHKSTIERMLPFYMLRCQCRIMNYHIKDLNQKYLPIIVPILFYNGEKKYTASTDVFDLFGDSEMARELMFKPIHLIDVGQISDEELKKHQWSCIMEFMMKHVKSREIMKFFQEIIPMMKVIIANQDDDGYIIQTIKYLFETSDIEDKIQVTELLSQGVSKKIGEEAMTLAERLRNEGWQEGRKEGKHESMQTIAKRMLAEGVEIQFIARFTDLSTVEIKALQEERV